ncbi:unnamed protein product [Rotaria sp. Silwood1]|nr:unnamed protein product [Rotaria sp. Silwood1]CAF1429016.1 unnamed protein product [Rotaria sp. Silwood1]
MSTSNDLGQWYKSIPSITRAWFTGSIIVPVAARLRVVNPFYLVLAVNRIIKHFEIWRLLTAILYCRMDFGYLINLYFIYQYSTRLETSTFDGKPADYVFCLAFVWLCTIIAGSILLIWTLMDSMVMSVIYIWCQLNKEVVMSFWFGIQLKAMYLPWALMLFDWIILGTYREDLCGIIIGHLYYFLVFKYPQDFGGAKLLQTPRLLYRYFPSKRFATSRFGTGPIHRHESDASDNTDNRDRQVFGGRGYVLGFR